ncbi:alpha/beta-hydrolase [Macroventuria anomochaeta]|uniref:Alpha/beta-hydrolase n=1 Tax=Macroventuria anomochaeta TaxID=301207 RepID=A0ACB6S5T2_9PLEO|nr:alpha/beta-hydrolase [Macroventuria anomochaeta]KAF2629323.1 alpha/beta-hydrolase [Macroventuria anomochaeta]
MAHGHSDPERRRRKRNHSSSRTSNSRSTPKQPLVSQPVVQVNTHVHPHAVQAVSTQHLNYPMYAAHPPGPPPLYPGGPPQHLVYGAALQYSQQYVQPYGSPPLQPVPAPHNPSVARFASPSPPQHPQPRISSREEGPFQQQWNRLDRMAAKSNADLRQGTSKLITSYIERPTHAIAMKSMQTLCQGAALCDVISSKFDAVITSIDDDKFSGKEEDLKVYEDTQQRPSSSNPPPGRGKSTTEDQVYEALGGDKGSNHFAKVWLYSNSRLPPHLPPFKVYMPTYPLLCLAATYSERVYVPPVPKSKEVENHIPANWRSGTKAMVLKSIPVEDMNTVVFAIRGSQTFMDWAVNYNSAPTSPEGFLDDPSNFCHAGFLYVARKMVKPVADRLRVLIQENPARKNCSLLITGHSAGGAVATLLYAHMMSNSVDSELSYLTDFFKRVHCVTFGAPPISRWPLRKSDNPRHKKSLFYSFINEGDPIPRADKSFFKSLIKLYTTPAPSVSALGQTIANMSKLNLSQAPPSSPPKSRLRLRRPSKSTLPTPSRPNTSPSSVGVEWHIPPCELSPAGRLIVLRQRPGSRREDDVEAVTVEEDMLRKVMYGDPLKHQMRVYKQRIDAVATRAVTMGG